MIAPISKRLQGWHLLRFNSNLWAASEAREREIASSQNSNVVEGFEARKIRTEYRDKNHEAIYEEQYKLLKEEAKTVQGQMRYEQQKTEIARDYTKKLEAKFDSDVRAALKKGIMEDVQQKMRLMIG